ncbi:amino-acid permease BAT1 homolog isoform X1 [Mangifera indica]|uniref:amino-acid permease BAT1 homolog isoform X1 n=1 Tax=Mangifera indica TaxID=29780 RepID=UPI001CFC0C46|nr:amino-acid permease BAT1 homolog isoform X1 [Mangifera indica]
MNKPNSCFSDLVYEYKNNSIAEKKKNTGIMDASGIRVSAEYHYLPLRNGEEEEHQDRLDDVSPDDSRLKQLGYKQELRRSLSAISSFSMTFSIISVVTGLTTLYSTGLTYGGPLTMIWGWPIVGLLTLIVGLSMAEICSAYPTSGGLYFWSAKLCGNDWGPIASWFTGWFNIVGQWAVTTSVDFSLAQMLQVIILLSTGGKSGGGYESPKYVVIAFHGAILLSHAIINSLPISILSFFGQLAALWNLLGVLILMILIPTVATERASAKFVFTHFNTDNGEGISSKVYIFVLGLLMSQYTLTGYDASAHMTEETKHADKNGPKGIISSIGISIIFGWGYLLGITFAVTNIPYLLSEDNDAGGYAIAEIFYLAFKSRFGSGVGGILCLGVVAVAIFFCGMSSVTSNSRMAYAFSRDGAMPFSSVWHKVNKQEVPINAVWLSAVISFCMALTYLGSTVAFQAMVSIATIGLYIAYALPIFFRVTLARKSFVPGPFNLGRYGVLVGWVAVVWVATISVLFSLPVAYPITSETLNYTPVAVGGLLLLTASSWIFSARHWFKGPIANIES